jgi:hypothetical protein
MKHQKRKQVINENNVILKKKHLSTERSGWIHDTFFDYFDWFYDP